MKTVLKITTLLGFCIFLAACGQSVAPALSTVTAAPSNSASTTTTPSPHPTFVVIPTQTPKYSGKSPTLVPTIDPTLVPDLLREAFSIQRLEDMNGRSIRKITGWDYGVGYQWLDSTHLRLYPRTGQQSNSFTGTVENVVPQPVIINLENGHFWLPKPSTCTTAWGCDVIYWSQELQILLTTGLAGAPGTSEKEAVFAYTLDGEIIDQYWGKLLDISPSGTKILVEDDTIIDLRTNKIVDLDWYIDYSRGETSGVSWSSDERHIYKCCYYYADTETGKSYSFEMSDFQGFVDGHSAYMHSYGAWVRNDTYFLVGWSWIDNGDQRYLPMFDPVNKKYFDVRAEAAIPSDAGCPNMEFSPDRIHVWLECWEGNYLINLETFDSTAYPNHIVGGEFEWSTNGKFAMVKAFDPAIWQVLSVSHTEFLSLPVESSRDTSIWWHPTETVVVYPSTDDRLIFLDVATMSYRDLAFVLRDPPYFYDNLAWSSNGEKLALVAKDGSLWQVDYPTLENLEQLTSPPTHVSSIQWSPDGNSLSFVSGSEIYIVESNN